MKVSNFSTSQILPEPSSRLILLPYLLIPFPLVLEAQEDFSLGLTVRPGRTSGSKTQ